MKIIQDSFLNWIFEWGVYYLQLNIRVNVNNVVFWIQINKYLTNPEKNIQSQNINFLQLFNDYFLMSLFQLIMKNIIFTFIYLHKWVSLFYNIFITIHFIFFSKFFFLLKFPILLWNEMWENSFSKLRVSLVLILKLYLSALIQILWKILVGLQILTETCFFSIIYCLHRSWV